MEIERAREGIWRASIDRVWKNFAGKIYGKGEGILFNNRYVYEG